MCTLPRLTVQNRKLYLLHLIGYSCTFRLSPLARLARTRYAYNVAMRMLFTFKC